jgi:hypothetical protein
MGKIIWLASYPKSGNTWLRAFLHNLLRNPQDGYDINKLDDFTLSESANGWYRIVDQASKADYTPAEAAALRPKVHRHLTTVFPDSIFVKTHCAVMEDHGVPTVTLDVTAGAIYVVRNPLDVTISYSHHLGISIDDMITYMTKLSAMSPAGNGHVHELLGSWSEHVESWTAKPNSALHMIRYEDMLSKPQSTFAGVVRFLGLKPPRDRLERAIARASFRVLQEQERRHGFKEKSEKAERFFREGKAGQWQKILTPAQVERITSAHATQMRRFGYLPLK